MPERSNPLQQFAALTFDCYGTLIDWESGILAVLRPWSARAGLRLSDDQLLEAFAAGEAAAESTRPTDPYPVILRRTHDHLSCRFGVEPVADEAALLARSVGDWPAFPDTPAALRVLKERFRLVIVSNVDRASFARTNVKLGVEFDAIVTAEDVKSYKPALPHFTRALQTLASMGIEKKRFLHVAQSLYHDHVPARALGIATVWIDRRRGRAGGGATPPPPAGVTPDWTFASMADFASAVEDEFCAR